MFVITAPTIGRTASTSQRYYASQERTRARFIAAHREPARLYVNTALTLGQTPNFTDLLVKTSRRNTIRYGDAQTRASPIS